MMAILRLALLLGIGLTAAACGTPQPPENDVLPTVAQLEDVLPTDTEPASPTSTNADAESEPPTATSRPASRPTLPPTWTPVQVATETPFSTPTIPPSTPLPANALPEACNTFDVIFEQTDVEFEVGTAPTVTWTPVAGATVYRVFLRTAAQIDLRDDIYVEETSYTFDAAYFEAGERYGWMVYPIDISGDQMCNIRGTELLPQRAFGAPVPPPGN